MQRTTDMTVGSPIKHILRFSIPLIVTNLGQQFYMIADAAIVGRGVGVKALAAVGATDWIYWLILWAVIGLTQGFSTFISRYYGDKNNYGVNKTIAMSTILCILLDLVLTVLGLLTTRPLLVLLQTPADILDGAVAYLTIMIGGTMIITAYNMAGSILRAFGDGRTPMIAMVIAALLNIGLDLLFVFVFRLGIHGAAIASIASQLIAFLYCLLQIRRLDCIRISRKIWKPDYKLIRALLFFGLPLSFQYIVISVGGIILQSGINAQGSIFVAGYTATNKAYGLLESSAISLGLACCTFLSQNYGAKNFKRVTKGVRTSVFLFLLAALVVMTIIMLIRAPLLRLFLDTGKDGGPEALAIGIHYLTIVTVCLPILYLLHLYRNALQSIEIAFWPMISGFAEFAARVIMAKCIVHHLGNDALFLAEPIAWFSALLSVIIPYYLCHRSRLKTHPIQ